MDRCSCGWRPRQQRILTRRSAATADDGFTERLAAIARALFHEPDEGATLKQTVSDEARTLAGAACASVALVLQRRQGETPVYGDDRAPRADPLQHELGQGPCLDPAWEQGTLHIDDLRTEPRYLNWRRIVVAETGIRRSLSLQAGGFSGWATG